MSQYTVAEGNEKGRISGNLMAPSDEAADRGAVAEGAPPRDISPTAEQQPAHTGAVDPASVVERPGEPAVAGETGAGQAEPVGAADSSAASAASAARRVLLDRETFQRRWREIQALFVDEPRHAVEEADSLVDDMVREFADSLAAQRSGIEHDWHGAGDASTEDFRVALLRYRDVFQLLVSV